MDESRVVRYFMFASDPGPSQYDWNFRLWGHNVRVNPQFWLTSVLLGLRNDPVSLLIWVAAVFVSILIHEMGHVWAMRRYGNDGDVLLYSFGGLAVPRGRANWSAHEDIVISAAGPGAGFVLAALVGVMVTLVGGKLVYFPVWGLVPNWYAFVFPRAMDSSIGAGYVNEFVNDVLWCSIFWGFMNLLPILPLDGGRISMAYWSRKMGEQGRIRAWQVSMVVASGMALLSLLERSIYLGVFYAWMAYGSYQALQQATPRWRRYN